MELREVLATLRAAWWLPVVGLVVGGVGALGVTLLQTPLYSSSTQLFVSARDTASTSEAFQGSQFSQQRVASYARLIAGEELAGRVIDRLDLDESPGELSEQITATAVADTVLIDVRVSAPSAEQAQRIASAVGDEFTALVTELETPDDGGVSPVKVTVTDQPEVASSPSSPRTARSLALGLFAGLLIGVCLAILRGRLDRTVKDPDEVVGLTGAPVIGTVLRDEALEKRHTIDRNSANRTAEDYRQLRTNLQFLNVDEPPKVIMVSSAIPSEGKTTAVVNLGLALADAGRRVTIVEADLRKPKVTRYLGLVGGVGLTNILAGTADLDEVIQRYGTGELSVIASGPTPPNPGELLASSHMFSLLDKLRPENDIVLVDAPPLLPVADSTGLAVYMDGVLLSVRYGSTRKEQLQQAAATLERVGAKTLGVILNIVPPKAELATAYGYGYGYGYDQPGSAKPAAG
ncbi:polysaccharide biosynthesis tyrosine autokinase [Geodermatophilus sp. SYSU D00708]